MAEKKSIQGKTTSGFKYALDPDRLNNYELLEYMAEVDNNALLFPKVLKLLLGEEQKNALTEHLRDDEGIIPLEKVNDELMEIFTGNQQTKN